MANSSTPSANRKPQVALAAGTHTWSATPESEKFQDEIVTILRAHGITKLDTSSFYGTSENALGNKGLGATFSITTKSSMAGKGALSRENLLKTARESLEKMKIEKVSVYLLHGPDDTIPISETYSAIQTLYEEGRFERFGVSNFTREQLLEYYNHAKSHNLVLPTVFQTSYSPAVRTNETLLFPTLRELGISIQAYSPMAAGFLSRLPADLSHPAPGSKYDPSTPQGRFNRVLFGKDSYVTFLEKWGKLVEESGVSRVGLAYRWVRYHSALKGELGDEMLVGTGTSKQFEETVLEIEKGPLEGWVVERIEGLWEIVKGDAEVDNLRAFQEVYNS